MTNPAISGYLERPYLVDDYMTAFAQMSYGFQVTMVIQGSKPIGVQTKAVASKAKPVGIQVKAQAAGAKPLGVQTLAVASAQKPVGVQVTGQISAKKALGVQVKAQTSNVKPVGIQVKAFAAAMQAAAVQVKAQTSAIGAKGVQVTAIASALATVGYQVWGIAAGGQPKAFQVKGMIIGTKRGYGVQLQSSPSTFKTVAAEARRGNFAYWDIQGYLVAPYLTGPYLIESMAAQGGVQVLQIVSPKRPIGVQVAQTINKLSPVGVQVNRIIAATRPIGVQTMLRLAKTKAVGVQLKGLINRMRGVGVQVYPYVSVKLPIGYQVTRVEGKTVGVQVTVVLYNATNLRILSSFPSRGNGSNWIASSTAPGDFSANNLNTDIVEQQWRSAMGAVVGVTLDCDTGVSSVFVDTIAILNHNFTSGAQITLQGSAFADQHIVGISIPLPVTKGNIIWVSPGLPNAGFRYWRFVINDPTNTQLRAGTIVFGSAMIFENDNITTQVKKSRVHFADKVPTEGYTDVMNDRALKSVIEVNFENLKYNGGNFQALDLVFQTIRTSLKALWIPDPRVPTRFGVFGKLPEVPAEQHNNLGGDDADYVSMTINIDESL